jgi:hypothetical protein
LRRLEARRLPDAVGHGTEAEQILRAVGLDGLLGVAGALIALADALDVEVRGKDFDQALGTQIGESGDEPVRRQVRRPGSLMLTSIMSVQLAGESSSRTSLVARRGAVRAWPQRGRRPRWHDPLGLMP